MIHDVYCHTNWEKSNKTWPEGEDNDAEYDSTIINDPF